MKTTDKAIEFRDQMAKLVDDVGGDDQEDHVVRCCLALAIEGLEEWIYNGEFTPSVEPTNDEGLTFFHEEGTIYRRQSKKSLEAKHPTVVRLAKEGKLKLLNIKMETRQWNDMSLGEREAFLNGDRRAFVRAVRVATDCGIKSANAFSRRMRLAHMKEWGCCR